MNLTRKKTDFILTKVDNASDTGVEYALVLTDNDMKTLLSKLSTTSYYIESHIKNAEIKFVQDYAYFLIEETLELDFLDDWKIVSSGKDYCYIDLTEAELNWFTNNYQIAQSYTQEVRINSKYFYILLDEEGPNGYDIIQYTTAKIPLEDLLDFNRESPDAPLSNDERFRICWN